MQKRAVIILVVVMLMFLACFRVSCLENADLSAQCAVLYYPDADKILFEKNADTLRSMASTTKIMTSLIALEECTPDAVVTVTPEMINVEGTSSSLCVGDKITLRDLVYCMMLESGNDAANAVALYLGGSFEGFAEMMNNRASRIGMKNTSFVTPSGLDDENHYTTAYDMALLAAEALENREFYSVSSAESKKITFVYPEKSKTMYNHNKLLTLYDGCIGLKTGFTKKSGRCLVSAAERNGIRLIAVTLNAGDDWNDHRKLLDYGFSCVKTVKADTSYEGFSLRVVGGNAECVGIRANETSLGIPEAENGKVTRKIYLPKFIYAPVSENDVVGYAEYCIGSEIIKTIPLTASENVGVTQNIKKQNLLRRFLSLLDSWWKNG